MRGLITGWPSAIATVLCVGGIVGFGIVLASQATTSQLCTLMDCRSGLFVDIEEAWQDPRADRVEVCADGRCREVRRRWGRKRQPHGAFFRMKGEDGPRPVDVAIDVFDRAGDRLGGDQATATLEQNAPNGVECGPICWLASMRFDETQDALVAEKVD